MSIILNPAAVHQQAEVLARRLLKLEDIVVPRKQRFEFNHEMLPNGTTVDAAVADLVVTPVVNGHPDLVRPKVSFKLDALFCLDVIAEVSAPYTPWKSDRAVVRTTTYVATAEGWRAVRRRLSS